MVWCEVGFLETLGRSNQASFDRRPSVHSRYVIVTVIALLMNSAFVHMMDTIDNTNDVTKHSRVMENPLLYSCSLSYS